MLEHLLDARTPGAVPAFAKSSAETVTDNREGSVQARALRAFSSEVDAGSREENASNQNHRASLLMRRRAPLSVVRCDIYPGNIDRQILSG
ncbi:hypothetical protein [Nitrobacter hamburgensis]|uniref:hypothetical protein n=1 Tax=Nitrobacter hamburgensis TaxID=912 RepID=UPI0018DBCDF0|nr:hypothetical protein [Nitrobacter hamburgensis]